MEGSSVIHHLHLDQLQPLPDAGQAGIAEGAAETLPQYVRQDHRLAAAEFALRNIHFPEDEKALELARRRLGSVYPPAPKWG